MGFVILTPMTDQTLKHLDMDGLLDLMLLSIKDLLEAMEKEDEIGTKVRKKQVELLQRLIVKKKEEALTLNKAL